MDVVDVVNGSLQNTDDATQITSGIVFIDPNVEDYESLIAGVAPGTKVFVLDSTRDGVEQITEVLAGRSGISGVHIVSHGGSGSLQLGGGRLSLDNLDNYASQLQGWAGSLMDGADILLYGCDVAAGEQGTAFVNQLRQLTGADVAASTDRTGNATLGGDWNLENTTGNIEAPLAFQVGVMEAYTQVLAATISTVSSWDGSKIGHFGEVNTATCGQTFKVPDGNNILNSFEIHLNDFTNPDAIDFAFYIMAWDGTKATGPILYESSKQTSAGLSGFEKFTFDTGNLSLNSGQQYVAFVSSSKFFDNVLGTGDVGIIYNDVYSGGSFVWFNNGSNFNALTTNRWEVTNYLGDAAFTASFSAPATNTAPTTSGISPVTVQEDADNTVIELFPAFADAQSADADLTYGVQSTSNADLFSGTAIDANGKLTLDYAGNANGTSNVTVRAADAAGLFVDTTFSVTVDPVNDDPALTATKATLAVGNEDTGYTISAEDLLTGFSDVDGDTLSVADLAATNGILGAYNATDGTWSFNPTANYNGSSELTYSVTDGKGATTVATQSFTLAAVNDAPTASDDGVSTNKGTAVTVELNDNVFDIEDLAEATLKTTDAVGGDVTLIDSDARQITFTPSIVGTASFKYTITDAEGLSSNAATVTVNVGDVISTGNQSQNITGNEGNDVISAGNGKDTISGLGGADILAGNNGVDTINSGDGNDKITGGNGADLLTGGSGSDEFVLAKGAGTDTISDFVAGTDVIGLSGGISFSSLSLSSSNIILTSSNETLASLTGVDTSTLTAANFVTV